MDADERSELTQRAFLAGKCGGEGVAALISGQLKELQDERYQRRVAGETERPD